MAVTGFWPIYKNLKATLDYADNPDKTTDRRYLDDDLYAALSYAENDNKTDRKMYVGGINCSKQNANPKQLEDFILKACEHYRRYLIRQRERDR